MKDSLGLLQDQVGRHLLQERNDGSPEVLVPVLAVHIWVFIVHRRYGYGGVIVEPSKVKRIYV